MLLAKEIKQRGSDKLDLTTASTGDEGSGKTSLAFYLSALVHPEANIHSEEDMKRIVDENMILNPYSREVIKKVNTLPHYSPIVLDEAIKVADKYLWNTREQKKLRAFFNTCRKQYKYVFMCIPDLFDLAPGFRNRRVMWWIRIIGRDKKNRFGIAALFRRKPITAGQDPWDQDAMKKILDTFYKNTPITEWDTFEEKCSVVRKLPNFSQFLTFPPMPESVEKHYEARVNELKEEMGYIESEKRGTDTMRRVASMVVKELRDSGKTVREISKKFHISTSTVHSLAKMAQEKTKT